AATTAAATTVTVTTTVTAVTSPVFDAKGHLVETPLAPSGSAQHLTKQQALAQFERYPKVADWLSRYPKGRAGYTDEETYDSSTLSWTVKLWWGAAGEIAEGTVDDASGAVTAAWTGPQAAWGMARGYKGAFGGVKINNPWIWGTFCLVFLI